MLSENLKSLRERRDYTKKFVSEILNISPSAYSFYETGRNVPSIGAIIKLAELYNVSTDYLLDCSTSKNKINEELSYFSYFINDLLPLSPQQLRQVSAYVKIVSSCEFEPHLNLFNCIQKLSLQQIGQISNYIKIISHPKFALFNNLIDQLQTLSPQQLLHFSGFIRKIANGDLNLDVDMINDINDLSTHQQQQVLEYVRLLKLDNAINGRTAKKKAKRTKSTFFPPALAAYGDGKKELDTEMDEDLHKAFDIDAANKETKD